MNSFQRFMFKRSFSCTLNDNGIWINLPALGIIKVESLSDLKRVSSNGMLPDHFTEVQIALIADTVFDLQNQRNGMPVNSSRSILYSACILSAAILLAPNFFTFAITSGGCSGGTGPSPETLALVETAKASADKSLQRVEDFSASQSRLSQEKKTPSFEFGYNDE